LTERLKLSPDAEVGWKVLGFKTKTEKIKDYTSALFINQANFDVYVKQT
jgi:hypothetical protein